MAIPTVTETITIGGKPVRGRVDITLVAAATGIAPGYVTAGSGKTIMGTRSVKLVDGTWSAVLDPNDGVSDDVIDVPTGTVYRVNYALSGVDVEVAPVYIEVPDDAGTLSAQDLVTIVPVDLSPGGVSLAMLDAYQENIDASIAVATSAISTEASARAAADTAEAAARTALTAAVLPGTAAVGQVPSFGTGPLFEFANPTVIDPTRAPYGVKFDRFTSTQGSMSSSVNPTHLTLGDYTFTSADIGKFIKVVGAAAAGANLKTTITGVSSGKAVLASPCLTTVASAFVMFGTDNASALSTLFADLGSTSRTRKLSRMCVMPHGVAMYSGTLYFPIRGSIKGSMENWASYDLVYGLYGGAENTGGTFLYQMWDQNVDCARVTDFGAQNDWQGSLQGFTVMQDAENTAGHGISFRDSSANPVLVIDGGKINNVAVMGAAQRGWDFAAGILTGTPRDIIAFGCGYADRVTFTGTTTNGSQSITGIASTAGLVFGGIITGPGIPVDSTIQTINSGTGTITITGTATASATVSIEQLGAPGIYYRNHESEAVHFDGVSGDWNSGGLLRLEGGGGSGVVPTSVTVTNLKNEFGANLYRGTASTVPQGSNAIVVSNMTGCRISVRGLVHWATSGSSIASNAQGRYIGAAILVIPTDSRAAHITWEAASVRLAAGSGQTVGYIYRDNHSSNIQPIAADRQGWGSNIPRAKPYRAVANASVTVTTHDSLIAYESISTARTATLPALSTVDTGAEVIVLAASSSVSGVNTITIAPNGADTIDGPTVIGVPYASIRLISNGTKWVSQGNTRDAPILVIPQALTATAGSPVIATLASARRVGMLFDATTDEIAAGVIVIPLGWNAIRAEAEWVNAGAGAGDVRWDLVYEDFAAGETLDVADGGAVGATTTAGAQWVRTTSVLSSSIDVVENRLWCFRVKRTGTSGADTLANDAALLALTFRRVR